MSTPQSIPTKGSHRFPRRSKNSIPAQSEPVHTSDSAPSPPTPPVIAVDKKSKPVNDITGHDGRKKKLNGPKKTKNDTRSERAPNHHKVPSQSDFKSPERRNATPIKPAYAGPTFHASPAASSLPIPKFYTKAMTETSPVRRADVPCEQEKPGPSDIAKDHSPPILAATPIGREASPLDFLFEAARQARETPRTQSPSAHSGNCSPFEDSPQTKPRVFKDSSSEPVFPFELDGNGGRSLPVGPSFATPYKERMNILRSSSPSTSAGHYNLDEEERKAKTEALKKKLFLNSQPHRPASASPLLPEVAQPNKLQITSNNNSFHQVRQPSGPSTPTVPSGHSNTPGAQQYFQTVTPTSHDRRISGSPIHRPISSHLRREYNPVADQGPAELPSDARASPPLISTARNYIPQHQTQPMYGSAGPNCLHQTGNPSIPKSIHNPRKLEEDLRRFLKLDLTSEG